MMLHCNVLECTIGPFGLFVFTAKKDAGKDVDLIIAQIGRAFCKKRSEAKGSEAKAN